MLPSDSSAGACADAGIDPNRQIPARGPFTIRENREHICRHGIDVLVTKDSGHAGGAPEKLAAAREENCQIVTIQRPDIRYDTTCDTVTELVEEVVAHDEE